VIVVQMHGEPGSGKSTLARALGQSLPAVVLDKDVIHSALLRSGVDPSAAGGASYESMRAVARELLAGGHSVIFDSPCFWPQIETGGRTIAADFGSPWMMIECVCPAELVEHRLATRARLESNPFQRGAGAGRPGMYAPACERLILDATQPLDTLVEQALAYARSGVGR
jgi:predicted kinase